MRHLLVVISLLLVSTGVEAWADGKSKLGDFDVMVDIHGDVSLRTQVRSYILEELRSLGDVVIVDNRDVADFLLRILCSADKLESGEVIGFSLVALELSPFAASTYDFYIEMARLEHDEEERLLPLRSEVAGLYQFSGLRLGRGPIESLRQVCKQIVARFDTTSLEGRRKAKIRDMEDIRTTVVKKVVEILISDAPIRILNYERMGDTLSVLYQAQKNTPASGESWIIVDCFDKNGSPMPGTRAVIGGDLFEGEVRSVDVSLPEAVASYELRISTNLGF